MSDESYPPPIEFLHWLEKFVGTWSQGSSRYCVGRRADGWLEAITAGGDGAVLESVIKKARKVADAEGPLGARPVVISHELMSTWLNDDELEHYRGALHVSVGRNLVLALIEQRIKEASPVALQHWLEKTWREGAQVCSDIPYPDKALYTDLFHDFRVSRLPGRVRECRYISVDADEPTAVQLPKARPRSARFVGGLDWSWSPMHSRCDSLFLSLDRTRKHWLLWFEWSDEGYSESRVVAYMPAPGLDTAAAARILVPYYYAEEEKEFQENGRPGDVDATGVLSGPDWMRIVDALWPEAESAAPTFPRIHTPKPQ
jgi:hypothetical protein